MLAVLCALLFAVALPAAAQATPPTASCDLMDLALGSGCGVTFPDTAAGDTATITVTLTAGPMSGGGPVGLSSSDPAYSLANDTCTGTTLSMPGQTCTFDLVFAPWDDGTPGTHARAQAGLTVDEGGMPDGNITIDAFQHTGGGGGGAPSYSGTVSPASKAFGSVSVGGSVQQTFTLSGTSADPLQVTGVALGGSDTGDYTIDSDDCTGETLNQSDTCDVDVTFAAPPANGPTRASSATLAFTSNADTAISVALSGTVQHQVRPGGSIAATSGSFTGITAGATANKTYRVTGTSVDGVTLGAASIGGTDAADYAIAADGCTGHTLNSGDTCDITVRFAPSSSSAARGSTAELDVASDAVQDISAPLSGTVVAAPAPNPSLSYGLGDAPLNGGDRIVFTNSGNVALHLTGATIAGQGAANVVITADGCKDVTLAVGATCDVGIGMKIVVAGAIHATVTVGGDASSSIAIGGAGQSVTLSAGPAGGASPTTVGGVVRKTYTFTNASQIAAHLTGATASGDAGFAVTADRCRDATLAAGGSCTVDTAFTANGAGTHVAQLKADGDGASGSIDVSVLATAPPTVQSLMNAGAASANALLATLRTAEQFGADVHTSTADVVSLLAGKLNIAIIRGGTTVATRGGSNGDAFVTAVVDAGPDDLIQVDGTTLDAYLSRQILALLERRQAAASASAAKRAPQPKIVGKTCANGRCKVKIQWPKTPGVYLASVAVAHTAAGTSSGYALAAVVLPRVTAPKALPTCVTQGQRAATNSVKLAVTPATKVTWTLAAAARQPQAPRGCASSKAWPALKASSRTLARGIVTGGSPSRTTSMAKILNKVRLAKLKPGFYRVQFTATSAGLKGSTPANWWIQVLPREAAAGS
jgi:hypothetical protein